MNKKGGNRITLGKIVGVIFIIWLLSVLANMGNDDYEQDRYEYDEKVFSNISSSENKILNENLKKYADKKGYDINLTYADTLDVIDTLNSGKKYDAIFLSNSVWLSWLDSSVVKTSSLRSTSITPVIFGIKESKARELGFVDKKVYTIIQGLLRKSTL